MKIIAKTSDDTWLAEVTTHEIATACGYGSVYSDQWKHAHRNSRGDLVGYKYEIKVAYSFHHQVLQHEASAASAANTLRALADLLTTNLPNVIIPPSMAKEKSENDSETSTTSQA